MGRSRWGLIAIAGLGLAVAGCSSSATPAAPATPKAVSATPVPTPLIGYASLADPTLRAAVGEGANLVDQMRHVSKSDYEIVANACSNTEGDFSNYNSAFRETFVPDKARSVYTRATQGFALLMASADECGMAADTGDPKSMKGAVKDMTAALKALKASETEVSPWYQSQS